MLHRFVGIYPSANRMRRSDKDFVVCRVIVALGFSLSSFTKMGRRLLVMVSRAL